MNKKGVELSMNVIIIAAIGLLVLVILAVLVINASGKAQSGTQACTVKGGLCQSGSTCSTGTQSVSGGICSAGQTCCSPFVAGG